MTGDHKQTFNAGPLRLIEDLSVRAPTEHRAALTGIRNGLPPPLEYVWRRGEAERDAEVAALVAAAQAKAAQRDPDREGADVCMCGSPMGGHSITDNHSPVSQADYLSAQVQP